MWKSRINEYYIFDDISWECIKYLNKIYNEKLRPGIGCIKLIKTDNIK